MLKWWPFLRLTQNSSEISAYDCEWEFAYWFKLAGGLQTGRYM